MRQAIAVHPRSVLANDRLDARFFTSESVRAVESLVLAEAAGIEVAQLGGPDGLAKTWAPSRFKREWAATREPSIPYLRPYDIFEYLPEPAGWLSRDRTVHLDRLLVEAGTILQSCSGRNLGPSVLADEQISEYALSHDLVRIWIPDAELRYYVLAYLNSPTAQAALRRSRAGSVIDHVTEADISRLRVPMFGGDVFRHVVDRMRRSTDLLARARSELMRLRAVVDDAWPLPLRPSGTRRGWTVRAASIKDRLDVAWNDPYLNSVRDEVRKLGGRPCGDLASADLPLRYKRYYVERDYGRPVLSGRQLLQIVPINLRYVSDRSFDAPEQYVVRDGMTVFGGVGRSEGRLGTPALVTHDRDGWLASNDVMRLMPHGANEAGSLYLAIASKTAQVQIKSLAYGSVIDHTHPWDIEKVLLPQVDQELGEQALHCWSWFAESTALLRGAVEAIEESLGRASVGESPAPPLSA